MEERRGEEAAGKPGYWTEIETPNRLTSQEKLLSHLNGTGVNMTKRIDIWWTPLWTVRTVVKASKDNINPR